MPNFPRLVISGLSGGGGKTLLALGLTRSLVRTGFIVKPYKKGPDYIDAAWLSLAAHRQATNLDPFFLQEDRLASLFQEVFPQNALAIIEGNRGLYDGRDLQGSCSTARLARILNAPIILAFNCTKMTRTAAAVVAGLASFEPIHLAAVVLNQVGSARHADLAKNAIEQQTGIPVLGVIPRLAKNPIPERHMGLQSIHAGIEDGHTLAEEKAAAEVDATLDQLADLVEKECDIPALLNLANAAPPLPKAPPFWEENKNALLENVENLHTGASSHFSENSDRQNSSNTDSSKSVFEASAMLSISDNSPFESSRACVTKPRIGYVRDAALWFYYEENLEALERSGAELIALRLNGSAWPELDGLYLGGGFPEMLAASISVSPRLADIRALSGQNRPIYAECGGFILLCQSLRMHGVDFPMAGIFPAQAEFCTRPQGLGYVSALVTAENPFHPIGTLLRGHEFHYSRCLPLGDLHPTLTLKPGMGMDGNGNDGLLIRSTFAAYTHIFAPAVPHWAKNFIQAAKN